MNRQNKGKRLNRETVNRYKFMFARSLSAVLIEFSKSHRTPESLRAADEVEHALEFCLGRDLSMDEKGDDLVGTADR